MKKHEILKSYFGYESFREFQEESIDALLSGRDLLTILPTGAGKSLCYQLPTLMMDGLSVVISPLIALMQDQVRALEELNIVARTINSDMSEDDKKETFLALKRGEVKLLYIAPERMILPRFIDFLKSLKINFFVIDEAHCVSEWGHEFRSDYRELSLLKEHFPTTPIAAFTATATKKVANDIARSLQLYDPLLLRGSVYRKNLHISCQSRIKNGRLQIVEFLQKHKDECGIIYAFTRRETEDLAKFLQSRNISARAYHAGLSKDEKESVFKDFLYDRLDIVVATIAFGMGIDKSNIRFVIHTSLPKTIESFYQEIGRAGRDGVESETLLLFSKSDEIQKRELINNSQDSSYQQVLHNKLSAMYRFANSSAKCRHKMLGEYFEDDAVECQKKCDNCLRDPINQVDITTDAKKFLSAIYRSNERFGVNYIIDLLRGSKIAKIAEFGHDKLSVYGVGKDRSKQVWVNIADRLLDLDIVKVGEHRNLILSDKAVDILKSKESLYIDEAKLVDKSFKKDKEDFSIEKDGKFEAFRELRAKIAKEANLPAYIVFSDKTLLELSQCLPKNRAQMLAINGIADVKYERYGEEFLRLSNKLRLDL